MSLNYLDFDGINKNENGEFDGIDVLVAMAKQGKINPWNIDIVQVADQFSAHVFQSKAQNLRYTSRVILYAAILLKMKSDILEGIDITDIVPQDAPDVEGIDDGFLPEDEFEDFVPTNNVISFDEVLERRTSVRLNRNRVVTLRDLVRQLEFYAQLDKKASIENAKQRARRVRSYKNMTAADMVNLAHDEYIKLGVQILKNNLTEILEREDKIELNELTLLGMDRITAYLSLLFLVSEGQYDLKQDTFYSDVYVVKNGGTTTSEDETEDEKDIVNEAIVKEIMTDDVLDIVDNVVSINKKLKTVEEQV